MRDIQFQKVSKAFAGQQVLKNFSALLPGGQASAFMGPSGCGKTTLARMVLGLEKPDSGLVTGGENLRFSCVFQEDRLIPAYSALANTGLVLPRSRWAEIAPALEATGLTGQDLTKPAASLSGGQKRRVALVRALLAESDMVVLDEAFKGLDSDTRLTAYQFVKNRLAGRTLLLITHDPEEAAYFTATTIQLQPLAR